MIFEMHVIIKSSKDYIKQQSTTTKLDLYVCVYVYIYKYKCIHIIATIKIC